MIEADYISELATKISTDITKVLINNSIEITSFTLKSVTDNIFTLKFNVLKSQTELITNIKLKKTDETAISDNDVNILVNFTEVIIRQTITISEVTQ